MSMETAASTPQVSRRRKKNGPLGAGSNGELFIIINGNCVRRCDERSETRNQRISGTPRQAVGLLLLFVKVL